MIEMLTSHAVNVVYERDEMLFSPLLAGVGILRWQSRIIRVSTLVRFQQ